MMATFFHLPREDIVFPLIFVHLDTVVTWKLRHVCRGFWKLCEDYFETFCPAVVYRELDESTSGSLEDRACVCRALNVCKKLKHINLHLLPVCVGLTCLQQKTSHSLMRCVWHVHSECQLVSLRLINVDCTGCKEAQPGWEMLGERCKVLRELHIECVSQFNDTCLRNVTKHCSSIVRLMLITLPEIQGTYLEKLAKTCPRLEVLSLSGSYNIRKEHLQRMVRVCHQLKHLDLSSLFSAVNDTTILTVKEFCMQLRWLSVAQCSRVTKCYILPLQERGVYVEGQTDKCGEFHKVLGQI